jgi:hypothetical protein
LSLGASGKADAGDSGEAAGGFGVAKAVILGTSPTFRWEPIGASIAKAMRSESSLSSWRSS